MVSPRKQKKEINKWKSKEEKVRKFSIRKPTFK